MGIAGEEEKIITGIKNTVEFSESYEKQHYLIVRRTELSALNIFLQKLFQNLDIHK